MCPGTHSSTGSLLNMPTGWSTASVQPRTQVLPWLQLYGSQPPPGSPLGWDPSTCCVPSYFPTQGTGNTKEAAGPLWDIKSLEGGIAGPPDLSIPCPSADLCQPLQVRRHPEVAAVLIRCPLADLIRSAFWHFS